MKAFPIKALIPGLLAASLAGGFAPAQAQDKELTLAWSLPALRVPVLRAHAEGAARTRPTEIGGITLIETDGQNQTTKQTADVEAAVTQGVDGIIISPLDAVAMQPAVQAAVDAGIPVVTIDRRVEGVPGCSAHVGADNVLGGEAQGKLIMELFPDGATIVNLQGQPGASPAIDRNKGAHNVLDPMPTSTSSSPSRPPTSSATRRSR